MPHDASPAAVVLVGLFVAGASILSWRLGRRTKGAAGYFAAHGQIPWFVNGVAFAGDYLSAASFLGICGMIAIHGYDGFLYALGLFAGWAVTLFVIAEPMQRLGKFTFADALDARFHSKGVRIAAGLSTLAASVFLLIPEMVGVGALAAPLLGLPHWVGVTLVGGVVIAIVTTVGMVSTTWVQFVQGGLLVVFSTILVGCVLWRGLPSVEEPEVISPTITGSLPFYAVAVAPADSASEADRIEKGVGPLFEVAAQDANLTPIRNTKGWRGSKYWMTEDGRGERVVWQFSDGKPDRLRYHSDARRPAPFRHFRRVRDRFRS